MSRLCGGFVGGKGAVRRGRVFWRSTAMTSNGAAAIPAGNGIDEAEAALYDRQIRLWGVDAQNRMRTSSVLLITLRGIATEIAKNIVLAGVGHLALLDPALVAPEDLGANFFLRDEDIGKLRVESAAPRIQALNPRVEVTTYSDGARLHDEAFLAQFDLVVLTDADAPTLMELNQVTRKLGKKLFAAGSVGMDGWIFADLLAHEFVVNKIVAQLSGESLVVPTKQTLVYAPFARVLEHSWANAPKRVVKKVPSALWAILTKFATELAFPAEPLAAANLTTTAATLLPALGVEPSVPPSSLLDTLPRLAPHEFPASTAIVGGLLGQDVLNALGGKEEPVRNFCVFEGETGRADVWALGV